MWKTLIGQELTQNRALAAVSIALILMLGHSIGSKRGQRSRGLWTTTTSREFHKDRYQEGSGYSACPGQHQSNLPLGQPLKLLVVCFVLPCSGDSAFCALFVLLDLVRFCQTLRVRQQVVSLFC